VPGSVQPVGQTGLQGVGSPPGGGARSIMGALDSRSRSTSKYALRALQTARNAIFGRRSFLAYGRLELEHARYTSTMSAATTGHRRRSSGGKAGSHVVPSASSCERRPSCVTRLQSAIGSLRALRPSSLRWRRSSVPRSQTAPIGTRTYLPSACSSPLALLEPRWGHARWHCRHSTLSVRAPVRSAAVSAPTCATRFALD
jgi:hypothetical protein